MGICYPERVKTLELFVPVNFHERATVSSTLQQTERQYKFEKLKRERDLQYWAIDRKLVIRSA